MVASLRRIGSVLCVMSIMGFGVALMHSLSFECGDGFGKCSAALFSAYPTAYYQSDFSIAYKTDQTREVDLQGSFMDEGMLLVQLVSLYGLLVALALLAVLECVQVYYLRRLVSGWSQKT